MPGISFIQEREDRTRIDETLNGHNAGASARAQFRVPSPTGEGRHPRGRLYTWPRLVQTPLLAFVIFATPFVTPAVLEPLLGGQVQS